MTESVNQKAKRFAEMSVTLDTLREQHKRLESDIRRKSEELDKLKADLHNASVDGLYVFRGVAVRLNPSGNVRVEVMNVSNFEPESAPVD